MQATARIRQTDPKILFNGAARFSRLYHRESGYPRLSHGGGFSWPQSGRCPPRLMQKALMGTHIKTAEANSLASFTRNGEVE